MADEYQTIQINGDRLTLDVIESPLSEVLDELSLQGVKIIVDDNINPEITAFFFDRPVEEAFSDILKGYGYALVWEKGDGAIDDLRVAELQIFHREQGSLFPDRDNNGNLQIAPGIGGRLRVKNTLLVELKKEYSLAELSDLLDVYNLTVLDYHASLQLLRLLLPENLNPEEVAKLLTHFSEVDSAEPDYAYPLGKNAVSRLPSPADFQSVQPDNTESSRTVAVLDSGLAPEYANSPYIAGTFDALLPEADIQDAAGHGTQMTLIAAGVINPVGVTEDESGVQPVLSVRAFDENGFTSTSTLIRAVDYAAQSGAGVLSLSWGSEEDSPLLERVVDYASNKGMVLVAAAGNEPTGTPVYPAAYDKVIGVGAVMPDGKPWQNSNYGDFVTLEAPGLAGFPVGYKGDPGMYAGTSISTAYAAKKIADALREYPDKDTESILNAITNTE